MNCRWKNIVSSTKVWIRLDLFKCTENTRSSTVRFANHVLQWSRGQISGTKSTKVYFSSFVVVVVVAHVLLLTCVHSLTYCINLLSSFLLAYSELELIILRASRTPGPNQYQNPMNSSSLSTRGCGKISDANVRKSPFLSIPFHTIIYYYLLLF